jgi:integrase
LGARDYVLFRCLADTGVRPSEALALQWPDIDFEARTVSVERSVTLGRQLKCTKTGGARKVPLTVPLAEALVRWQRVVRKHSKSEYVFPSRQTGTPLNVKRVARRFRRVLGRAELGPFRLYDLRHTYASHLLDQRIKPVDVAKVMGHRSTNTTLAFYEHWIPQDMGYIANKLTAARQKALAGGEIGDPGGLNGDSQARQIHKP